MNTQSANTAAGEHFADAERILAALPLVKRRAEPDRHIQIALVHATLAVAAGLPREWQNREEPPDQPRQERHERRPAGWDFGGAFLVDADVWSAPRDRLRCREPGRAGQSCPAHRRRASPGSFRSQRS